MTQKSTRRGETQNEGVGQALPDVTICQVQPDLHVPHKRYVRGFTLIELLVVVLIIGILTAVAVPQYQKAALKIRFNTLFPIAKALASANETYYLTTGEYAANLRDLDVENTDTQAQVTLGNTEKHQYVKLTQVNLNNNLIWYQKHSPNFAGEVHCEAQADDDNAVWLCAKALEGRPVSGKSEAGYKTWALEGSGDGAPQAVTYTNYMEFDLALENGDKCMASQQHGCAGVHATGDSVCEGNSYGGCGPGQWSNHPSSFDDRSKCIGNETYACIRGTYTNNSNCEGNFWNLSCGLSTYKSGSSCIGTSSGSLHNGGSGACTVSTFQENSFCEANLPGHCNGSTFKSGSYCVANVAGACVTDVSKYDSTSYCKGKYCPVGAPKQGGGSWQECAEGQDGYGEEGRTC